MFGTNADEQYFLWRAFTNLSNSWVSTGNKALQLQPVHPLIMLEAGTETVEDYLNLGREASPVKFQQVLQKPDE